MKISSIHQELMEEYNLDLRLMLLVIIADELLAKYPDGVPDSVIYEEYERRKHELENVEYEFVRH
jgi:hypothetical protein